MRLNESPSSGALQEVDDEERKSEVTNLEQEFPSTENIHPETHTFYAALYKWEKENG